MWELDYKESWVPKNWCFWSVVLEKTLENPLDTKEIRSVHPKGNQSWVFIGRTDAEAETPILWPPHGKLTHWKRPWCWEGLGAGGDGDDRGWDGWMASPTRWTCVWVNTGSLWWTGRPGVLWLMGSQRVGHDWATELNWTEIAFILNISFSAFLRSIYICVSLKYYVILVIIYWEDNFLLVENHVAFESCSVLLIMLQKNSIWEEIGQSGLVYQILYFPHFCLFVFCVFYNEHVTLHRRGKCYF